MHDAIAACAEGKSSTPSKACRRAAKQAARDGARSCRASMRECVACCDAGAIACAVGVCGDGLVESREACEPTVDDGSCSVGCTADCTCAECGNGVIDAPFETCEPTDDAACPGLCSAVSCACVSATTDTCEAPREIAPFPYIDVQGTLAATIVPSDAPFACGFEGPTVLHGGTVWYAFTPPGTGRVSVDTAASTVETVLGAWTGTCDAPIQVACDDDSAGGYQSLVHQPVVAGTTYTVLVTPYLDVAPDRLELSIAYETP